MIFSAKINFLHCLNFFFGFQSLEAMLKVFFWQTKLENRSPKPCSTKDLAFFVIRFNSYLEGYEMGIPDLSTFLEITNNCTSTNFLCGVREGESRLLSPHDTGMHFCHGGLTATPLPPSPFSTLSIPRGELESQPTSQNSFIAAQFSAGLDPRPLGSRTGIHCRRNCIYDHN